MARTPVCFAMGMCVLCAALACARESAAPDSGTSGCIACTPGISEVPLGTICSPDPTACCSTGCLNPDSGVCAADPNGTPMNDGVHCGQDYFFLCGSGSCSVEACPAPTTCSGSLRGDLDAAVDGCRIADATGYLNPVGPIFPTFTVGGSAGGATFDVTMAGFAGQLHPMVILRAPDAGTYQSDPDAGTNTVRATCCGANPANTQMCRFGGTVSATIYPAIDGGTVHDAGSIDFQFTF